MNTDSKANYQWRRDLSWTLLNAQAHLLTNHFVFVHVCDFFMQQSLGKKANQKKQKVSFLSIFTLKHLFNLLADACICLKIDSMNSGVLSNGLDERGKGKFPLTEYSRLKIK